MIPHAHDHIYTLPANMPDCVATGLVICKVANTDLYVYHNTAEK